MSKLQAKLPRRLVADAGLENRIEIRVTDYREVADGPFDAVASIYGLGSIQATRRAATAACAYANRWARQAPPGG